MGTRAKAEMQKYDTKYYTIYTDIDPDDEREAAIRMTRMAEEYHARTRGFAGTIREKFPFYLFKSSVDYYDSGGMPGSAGVFISDGASGKLMAIAGQKTTLNTWHTVQHEGFHQFAHAVIGGEIPTWLNEGLAEYFGESIFTGDGFVTGVIPPWRLARLKREINEKQLKSIADIMSVSPEQWAREMNIRNYDQAWSMVHFLVNADDGKYQPAFSACIREISQRRPFDRAWLDTIGSADGFQDRWREYWTTQPPSPTSTLYAKAAVATFTSFLGRATSQHQSFADFDAFTSAAKNNTLKINPQDWLPHSLLEDVLRSTESSSGKWELQAGVNKQPALILTLENGTRLTGSFSLRDGLVDHVDVDVDDLAKILDDAATALATGGKKTEIKAMVQTALRENPRSAAAPQAKKFLQSLR